MPTRLLSLQRWTRIPISPADSSRCNGRNSYTGPRVPCRRGADLALLGPAPARREHPRPPLRRHRPRRRFMLDFDQPLTVLPTFGVGWFGKARCSRTAAAAFCAGNHGCEIGGPRRVQCAAPDRQPSPSCGRLTCRLDGA